MFDLRQLEQAQAIVGAAMPPTPAYAWPLLSERLGATAIVKHENHTPIGAFKVRGGLVYVDRLKRERPDTAGLISATRGNHGQSLAFAAGRYGVPVTIYVPHGNSVEKNRAMRAFGARLVEYGEDFQAAREEAERHARRDGLEFVPSFHPDLVMGVATYALELFRSVEDLDVLYVPIGQGSGICGCILARDLLGLATEIVGVQSTEAPSYALSFAAGTVVATNSSNTLADGMATRVPTRTRWPSSARAPRASSRSATTKWPRRSAPTGPIRIISARARAPRRSPPPCRKSPGSGASGSA